MAARKYTADQARIERDVAVGECAAVIASARDEDSAAIGVAIHLEDALGVVLPESAIDRAHLGSVEAIERTLDALAGTR